MQQANSQYKFYRSLSKHGRQQYSRKIIMEYIKKNQGVDMATMAEELGMHLPRVMAYVGAFMREDKVQWSEEP